jgi:hypothetical protein
MLCYLSIGHDEAARDIVNVLYLSVPWGLGMDIKEGWAGCHFPKEIWVLIWQVEEQIESKQA